MSRQPTRADVRAAALAHAATGASYREIAETHGISERSVRNWCSDAGMPARRPGRKPAPLVDDIPLAGRWVRDGLIMRHVPEGAA